MVHRDVKPANCLFVDGQLKLADFGLLTEADRNVSRLGTRKYMPPDGRMDARADVYAAGLVIYEMITALPADCFPGLGDRAGEIAASATLAVLNRLVLRACQADPDDRFEDARAMQRELAAAEPKSEARTSRRLFVTAAVISAALMLAGVLCLILPRRVDVNFITDPFEATIYLHGRQLLDPHGRPYRTPCTVPGLTAGTHHVVFEHERLEPLDAGECDLAEVREIVAQW